jgi:hypothetical protein
MSKENQVNYYDNQYLPMATEWNGTLLGSHLDVASAECGGPSQLRAALLRLVQSLTAITTGNRARREGRLLSRGILWAIGACFDVN